MSPSGPEPDAAAEPRSRDDLLATPAREVEKDTTAAGGRSGVTGSPRRSVVGESKGNGSALLDTDDGLRVTKGALQAECSALRKKAVASTATISALEKRLQRSEERSLRAEERLQQSKEALGRMRSQRDAMVSRNKGVREQLAAVRSSAQETVAGLRGEKAGLRSEIRDLKAAVAPLGAEGAALRREVAASAASIRALEKRLLRSEERLQRSDEALGRMRSERDAMAARNKGIREQLAAVRSSAQEAVAGLRGEKVGLRSEVRDLKAAMVPLRAEGAALRREATASATSIGALEKRLRRSEERWEQSAEALVRMRAQRDAIAARTKGVREQLAAVRSSAQATVAELRTEKAGLRERVLAETRSSALLRLEATLLRKQETSLTRRVGALESRLLRSGERLQRSEDALEMTRSQRNAMAARNDGIREQLRSMREGAAERQGRQVERLAVARERLSSVTSLWAGARKYSALYRQGLLFDEMEKSDVDFSADTYLCLLPSTVPAAMTLNRLHGGGGRIICDSVENVEVHKHSLAPNLHAPTLEMVNLGAYGALTAVDGIMTVSNAVAKTLDRFGPPVRLQPNYRRYERPSPAGDLRQRLGLGSESTILVTTGNVVKGFDTVIDALALLPQNVHLVALVKMSPLAYDAEMRDYIERKGLSERVHLLGFVPYHELAGVLSDADLGLITLDPENPNHSVSLPNRVFDFTTAGLPFVAPPLAEIAAFVEKHRCGAVVPVVSAEAWAETIQGALQNLPDYRDAMRRAREEVTWESLDDGLVDFLGNPRSVTLLGFRDLSRYQRFLRVTDSLTQRGIQVKAVFYSEDPLPLENSDAEFYHFADRYGRGPGLRRVPISGG